MTLTPNRIRENILIIKIYAESITLILCGLARLVCANEVMRKEVSERYQEQVVVSLL